MTDFERECYRDMDSAQRCLIWMMKAMDMQEYAELMTPEDVKLLRKVLEGAAREPQPC